MDSWNRSEVIQKGLEKTAAENRQPCFRLETECHKCLLADVRRRGGVTSGGSGRSANLRLTSAQMARHPCVFRRRAAGTALAQPVHHTTALSHLIIGGGKRAMNSQDAANTQQPD